MGNRIYNILLHTHTVSGIVMSVVLFVIFFAGSFSFFRDEIINWERNESVAQIEELVLDFDSALDILNEDRGLNGRDITITQPYKERRVNFNATPSKDTLAAEDAKSSRFFYLDTKTFETFEYQESYNLGEFIYRLHFLAQIPYPYGYYLSGFTAFFFLFAMITGVLVHWKKIISNFFTFRPWAKLKTLWTDAHTALGMIGLPFQFIYAVTGAFFMIKLLLVAPVVAVVYEGDQHQLYEDLEYNPPSFSYENSPLNGAVSINGYVEKAKKNWQNFIVTKVQILNYMDVGMHVLVEGKSVLKERFTSNGNAMFEVSSGELISSKDPLIETSYLDGVKDVLFRLHFGDYGGYPLKIVSFFLGIIGCFVILSGVMIWLKARDKKNVSVRKKKFNDWIAQTYLAVCMSMFPMTALSFIIVKMVDYSGPAFLYTFYFVGWLIFTLLFIFKKDLQFTNKYSLFIGGILGLCIPVANGIATDNWFWNTIKNQQFDIFFIDIFWISISAISLFAVHKITKSETLKLKYT